ncbi:hypothetical protein [Nocardia huaxiensis]|uniref:Uncharacterized protein n=1 Tax=Nocardia huaxiensis TaxID=2755382 RepID=A0A7D6ZJT5_9NOCA|nr:hypothetical protein [Nocardia huaxiensis]QLY32367.1 hypothetical protein H0264_08980 [Nocardia huaxiensis]UFS93923.1 hypothetical protein LPY97_24440 [Nocardia huaxiensis]
MRLAHLALLAAAPALVVGLTACGKSSDSAKSTTTSAAATTTSGAAVVSQTTAPKPLPPNPTRPPVPTTQTLHDVDCGPITGANGKSANVIAYANQAGIPGCTEAITVASDYVNATRTGDAVEVDGWTCEPQPDTAVPHICFKDGFLIGLRGDAAPNPPAPPTTTTPPPTTTDKPIADVDCGTVTDAGGGTRSVVAVGTSTGVVGCTEAINVATEYAQTITTGDALTVQGWNCAATAGGSACTKDGLIISLR